MADSEIQKAVNASEAYEETLVETIKRLAELPSLDYERCRKQEAKRLDMRAPVLDREVKAARPKAADGNDLGLFDPEPWSEEVDGDDLLDRIVDALRTYVVMPPHVAEATALWALHCHCFENWQHTPRLGITAPEKGCGKSTLLDVLAHLVPRAIKTENLSTAAMFRMVDGFRPTLLIDEVDTFLRDNEELRGALNAGHAKGARHYRCEGDNHDIRAFTTFAPAAMAGIGRLPETLADRSILVVLHRRKPDERVRDFRSDRVDHLRELAEQAARWIMDHETALRHAEPDMPDGIHNRRADNWRPLLSIADVAGGEWPERARRAARALSTGEEDADSIRVQLIWDIQRIFDETGESRLPSKMIVERLHEMEGSPWPEYGRKQQPISVNQMARLLKPFAVSSGTIRWGEETPKGYKLDSFKDVLARYPPFQNATTPQTNVTAGLNPISKRHNDVDVADGKSPKPNVTAGCGVVADGKGGCGDKTLFQGNDGAVPAAFDGGEL
jgi:putative DNA primase/helicase